jgi:hypothetical protein
MSCVSFRVAPRFQPSLATAAGEPFDGFCLGLKAGDMFLLTARVSRDHIPASPTLLRLGIECHLGDTLGHEAEYEPSLLAGKQRPVAF